MRFRHTHRNENQLRYGAYVGADLVSAQPNFAVESNFEIILMNLHTYLDNR